ncbi:MAG: type IV pilus assembly protein PilO [Cellvibrionaceae bacterium]|jgi:type IV pilus assembly protein PilO
MALQDTLDQLNNLELSNIDWSKIGVWPLAGRVFVWSLTVVAVLLVTYIFLIKDLHDKLDRTAATEETLKQTFQQKAFQAATLDQYKQLMAKMERDFEFLVSQLPEKTQVPGLLDDIDEKGRDSGLEIDSIKLQSEVIGKVYVELPIEIVVKGSYHNFGTFVSSIAGMSRIVTLHNYEIFRDEKESPSILRMRISAKTYRYRSEEDGDIQ